MFLLLSLLSLAVSARQKLRTQCSDNKTGQCKEITRFVEFTNSWTCRSCFNIRVNYEFKQAGTLDFDSEDNIIMAFKNPIIVVKFAYPVIAIDQYGIDDAGSHLFMVRFVKHYQYGDKRMDFNAEFREQGEHSELEYAFSCPCKNRGKIITASSQKEDQNREPTQIVPVKEEVFSASGEKNKICGDILTANWDEKDGSPMVENGNWECHKYNAKKMKCNLHCDGFNTQALSVCRFVNDFWSPPRRSIPNCSICSIDTLKSIFELEINGSWNCSIKPDTDNSVKICQATCPTGQFLKLDGKEIAAHVKCRANKGWKLAKGTSRSVIEAGTKAMRCV